MGGERAGKSLTGATYLTSRHLLGVLFWIVAWDYDLCRAEFDYVTAQLETLGNIKQLNRPKEGPCLLETLTGQVIETKSGQDPRRLAAKAPDGILGCEVSLWPYEMFLRVRGRLAEKRGWLLATGSFETSLGWLPEKFEQWRGPNDEDGFALSMPTDTNFHLYPGGSADPEILALKAQYPEQRFIERFEGRPCPPSGRVFSEARTDLHVDHDATFNERLPVYLAIDPGWGSAYSVLAIQEQEGVVCVIDGIHAQRWTHNEVIISCQTRRWWRNVRYAVMDVAGRQHHAERAPKEVWAEDGRVAVYDQYVHIQDGIDRMRTFLRIDPSTGRPSLRINPSCKGLLAELGLCPTPVEGGGVYSYATVAKSDKPTDKNNHACKALAYYLIHEFGNVRRHGSEPVSYLDFSSSVDAGYLSRL
jgi:hypothetical protein